MVPSQYNIVAPTYDGNAYILFNTKNQVCVILNENEHSQYLEMCEGKLEEGNLYNRLVELDVMTVDQKTELGSMRHAFEHNKFDSALLELHICPTLDFEREGDAFGFRREGVMGENVQEHLIDFIREQYLYQPFKLMKVEWLVVDVAEDAVFDTIKHLNTEFKGVADELDVEYRSSALMVGKDRKEGLEDLLAACGISEIIDAKTNQRCKHTVAQPSKNEDFVVDIRKGEVKDFFNQDSSCADLRGHTQGLSGNVDFSLAANLTNFDISKTNRESEFKKRAMALMEDFLAGNPTREDFEVFLTPLREYCGAAPERSYAIDELGNAYVCTRDLGCAEQVLFNLCEPVEQRRINMKLIAKYGIANPLNLNECSQCRVYPLCMGGCARVRVGDGKLTCIPQRFIIEEYLTEYSRILK